MLKCIHCDIRIRRHTRQRRHQGRNQSQDIFCSLICDDCYHDFGYDNDHRSESAINQEEIDLAEATRRSLEEDPISKKHKLTIRQAEAITIHTYGHVHGQLTDLPEACGICLDSYTTDSEIKLLPCHPQHVFHATCIDAWMVQCVDSCPFCKKTISEFFKPLDDLEFGYPDVGVDVGVGVGVGVGVDVDVGVCISRSGSTQSISQPMSGVAFQQLIQQMMVQTSQHVNGQLVALSNTMSDIGENRSM